MPARLIGKAQAGYLSWLVAVLVFLILLATLAAWHGMSMASNARQALAQTLTLQLPAEEATPASLDHAQTILKQTWPDAVITVLSPEENAALLAPWLGQDFALQSLALPRLIDIQLSEPPEDLSQVRERLQTIAAGASLDSHQEWLDDAAQLLQLMNTGAALVIALLFGALALAVVLATRMNLALNSDVLKVLYLVGATDSFIAKQFAAATVRLSVIGAGLGMALAVMVILIGKVVLRHSSYGVMMPESGGTFISWLLVVCIPGIVAGIALLACRATVTAYLAKMI